MNKRILIKIALSVLLIIPSNIFCQGKEFPYKLEYVKDISLCASALSLNGLRLYLKNNKKIQYLSKEEISKLTTESVPFFDKNATKNWDPELAKKSDITKGILEFSPLIILFSEINHNQNFKNILTIVIMYAEGNSLNENFTQTAKYLAKRKRPFFYNKSTISEWERNQLTYIGSSFAYESFYSGHSSSAFFSAVFLSKVYTDLYGSSLMTYVIWGTSLSLATTTAYLRVKSGWHFPSDVLVGAIAGSFIGYIVPAIHKKSPENNLSFSFNGNQVGLKYNF